MTGEVKGITFTNNFNFTIVMRTYNCLLIFIPECSIRFLSKLLLKMFFFLSIQRQKNYWTFFLKYIIHTFIHPFIHSYIHTHIHPSIHIMHTYIYTYHTHIIHTYIHIYIHTYIHTCLPLQNFQVQNQWQEKLVFS